MGHILILESNSPEIIEAARASKMHTAHERFVLTAQELGARDMKFTVQTPYAGDFDPAILHDVEGVILTGSGVNWSVDDSLARPLQNAAHAALNSGLPIWGSCNGLQMAAWILGGKIGASPNGKEQGIAHEIALTDAGKTHPMMAGRSEKFTVPCVHRDEVQELPKGAVLLASNAHSPVQAMIYETGGVNFWGTQYHPEFSYHYVGQILAQSDGIFEGDADYADRLMRVEKETIHCEALGIGENSLPIENRANEYANWLRHFGFIAPKDVRGG